MEAPTSKTPKKRTWTKDGLVGHLIAVESIVPVDGALTGEIVFPTGKFRLFKNIKEVMCFIEACGGFAESKNVTRKITKVLCGADTSRRALEMAKKLKIKNIVTEEEFINGINREKRSERRRPLREMEEEGQREEEEGEEQGEGKVRVEQEEEKEKGVMVVALKNYFKTTIKIYTKKLTKNLCNKTKENVLPRKTVKRFRGQCSKAFDDSDDYGGQRCPWEQRKVPSP